MLLFCFYSILYYFLQEISLILPIRKAIVLLLPSNQYIGFLVFIDIQTKLHIAFMIRCQWRNHFQNKKDLSMVQELHGKNGNLKWRQMKCWMLMLTLLWILS